MKLLEHPLFLQLLLAAIVLGIFAAPFFFKLPTYQDKLVECVTGCGKKGQSGRLARRDKPASPKDTAQDYDCMCT